MRKATETTLDYPELRMDHTAPFVRMGHLLRSRREELNLSLKEVESTTSIRTPYLQALEEGQMDRLISPVYAQGFLRKYATCVQLEEHPLVEETFAWLQGKQQESPPAVLPASIEREREAPQQEISAESSPLTLFWVIAPAAVLLFLWWIVRFW